MEPVGLAVAAAAAAAAAVAAAAVAATTEGAFLADFVAETDFRFAVARTRGVSGNEA